MIHRKYTLYEILYGKKKKSKFFEKLPLGSKTSALNFLPMIEPVTPLSAPSKMTFINIQRVKKELSKYERIELKKKEQNYRNRHNKRIEKFSDGFNKIFFFFLQCYRKKLLIFAGSYVDVEFDINSHSCREAFRRFDDGQFKHQAIKTKHPNIVRAVIIAKKSWGLHLSMYSEGIAEGTFTKSEILLTFEKEGITLPDQFQIEFDNIIQKKRIQYHERFHNKNFVK